MKKISGIQNLEFGPTESLVAYVAFPRATNYGDQLLPRLAARLFHRYSGTGLRLVNVPHRNITQDLARYAAVIVAPGGYITGRHESDGPDSPHKWFVDMDATVAAELNEAGVPYGFFGSGVNIWKQKRRFDDAVKNEVGQIMQGASFVYLRGRYDMDFLQSFCQTRHGALAFQPCPSLFLRDIMDLPAAHPDSRTVAINIGADQLQVLYDVAPDEIDRWKEVCDQYYQRFADRFTHVVAHLRSRELEPVFVCNTAPDYYVANVFFPDCQAVPLYDMTQDIFAPEELLPTFRFAIGMRLHGWMPYLGCDVPALFISPFEKRQLIPGDIGLPSLACPIHDDPDQLDKQIISGVDRLLAGEPGIRKQVTRTRKRWFKKTQKHMARIGKIINEARPTSPASRFDVPAYASDHFLVKQGKRALGAKQFEAALVWLERSPTPEATYHQGLCHMGLGDHVKAQSMFQAVIDMTSPRPPRPLLIDARRHLAKCEAKIAGK